MPKMVRAGIRDASVVFSSRVVVAAGGLAIQSCLAWFLGAEGRGSYAVCVMYSMLLTIVCTFGVDGGAQYFVASKKMSVSEGVSALLLLEGVGALLAIGGGVAVLFLPLEFFNKASDTAFLIAVAMVPGQMFVSSLELVLAAKKEFPFSAIVVTMQTLLRLALIVVLVKIIPLGVNGAVAANLIAFVVCSLAILVFLRLRHQLHWITPKWEHIRSILGFGMRYYFAAFGMLMNFQIGAILLAFYASKRDVGWFHSGVSLIVQVIIVSDVIGTVIHPRMAGEPGGRPELAAQSARLVGLVCGAMTLVFLVLAKPIVAVLLSPDFLPVVPVLWILGPGVVFRAATKIFVHYLKATDHPGAFSVSTIVGTVANLMCLIVLLPVMGLEGAALAMTIGYFVTGTILMWSFMKHSGLSLAQSWLPQRADLELVAGVFRQARSKVFRRYRQED